MYCSNCGESVTDGVNFCHSCGSAINASGRKHHETPSTEPPPAKKFFLIRLALGEYGLRKTFWLFNVTVYAVLAFMFAGLFAYEQYLDFGALLISLLGLAYMPFVFSGIWRSAKRYDGRAIWKDLAQLSVVVGVIAVLVIPVLLLRALDTMLESAPAQQAPGFPLDVTNLDYELPAHTLICLPHTSSSSRFFTLNPNEQKYSSCNESSCVQFDATFDVADDKVTIKTTIVPNRTITIAADGSYVEEHHYPDRIVQVNRGDCYENLDRI